MPPSQLLLLTAALTAAAAGLLTIAFGLFWDRTDGRPRCPRCWYDLRGHRTTANALAPCPECGYTPQSQRDLRRTRRHSRPILVGLLLTVGGGLFAAREAMLDVDWWPKLPTSILIRAIPYAAKLPQEYSVALDHRLWPGRRGWVQANWAGEWPSDRMFSSLTEGQKHLLGKIALHTYQHDPAHPLSPMLLNCLSLCHGDDAPAAQAVLIAGLSDPTAVGRATAAAALGRLDGDKTTIAAALTAALKGRFSPGATGEGRLRNIQGVSGDPPAGTHGFPSDAEADWRVEAIAALGSCSAAARDAVPILIDHLDNAFVRSPSSMSSDEPKPEMMVAIWRTLGEIGSAAREALERAKSARDAFDAWTDSEACIAALRIGGEASSRDDALNIMASNTKPSVRCSAIRAMYSEPFVGPTRETLLVSMLSDQDAQVRLDAAEALLRHGIRRDTCFLALTRAPDTPGYLNVWHRVQLLWQYDLDPAPLLPELQRDLDLETDVAARKDLEAMIAAIKAGRQHPIKKF